MVQDARATESLITPQPKSTTPPSSERRLSPPDAERLALLTSPNLSFSVRRRPTLPYALDTHEGLHNNACARGV